MRALVLAVALLAGACGGDDDGSASRPVEPVPTMALSSPAFDDGGAIPVVHTCEGENLSPPLEWRGVPDEAVELAVLVTDPDAPSGTFTHWSAWGLAPELTELEEGALPAGAIEGTASSGKVGYVGPCPPAGDDPHRYRFEVIALGAPLTLEAGAQPDEVAKAIDDAALAGGLIIGRYGR